MTVNKAVVALRNHLKQTQQRFATDLDMSISALQNYEQNRMPEAKQLLRFQRAAQEAGRYDLVRIFLAAVQETLGFGGLASVHRSGPLGGGGLAMAPRSGSLGGGGLASAPRSGPLGGGGLASAPRPGPLGGGGLASAFEGGGRFPYRVRALPPLDEFEQEATDAVLLCLRGVNQSAAAKVIDAVSTAIDDPTRAQWFEEEAVRRGIITITKSKRRKK